MEHNNDLISSQLQTTSISISSDRRSFRHGALLYADLEFSLSPLKLECRLMLIDDDYAVNAG